MANSAADAVRRAGVKLAALAQNGLVYAAMITTEIGINT